MWNGVSMVSIVLQTNIKENIFIDFLLGFLHLILILKIMYTDYAFGKCLPKFGYGPEEMERYIINCAVKQ